MRDKVKENMYRLLYRFLRENGILGNYVTNLIKRHDTKGNPKIVLQSLVDRYISTEGCYHMNNCSNIFNWGIPAFFWSKSIEGENFWRIYHNKWVIFYKQHKLEYDFE